MKKIKCFLMLSLIVILAAGVFTGCSVKAGVDPLVTPHLVTYCANGGNLGIDAKNVVVERYFYMQDNVLAHKPDQNSKIIKPVSNSKYKFMGWAKGKTDANGNPLFRDTPIRKTDGGVFVSPKDGPVSEAQAEVAGDAVLKYYDYEDVDTVGYWDFSKDLVTKNTVLVAIWEEYNKYIIAEKDEQGKWKDYSDLKDGNIAEDEELAAKYANKVYDVTENNGATIYDYSALEAYDKIKDEGNTLIAFYSDPELTTPIGWPFNVEDAITVIYPHVVEGIYDLVYNAKTFQGAIKANKNIYLTGDVDLKGTNLSLYNNTYTGTIMGNGYAITNASVQVAQVCCSDDLNYYGSFFGVLNGAEIRDLTINLHVAFEIGIDPTGECEDPDDRGTESDAMCYVGVFAKSMNNCKLEGVVVNVEYEVTRKLVSAGLEWIGGISTEIYEPNTYEVEVEFIEDWSALEGEGNEISQDCELNASEYQADEGEGE